MSFNNLRNKQKKRKSSSSVGRLLMRGIIGLIVVAAIIGGIYTGMNALPAPDDTASVPTETAINLMDANPGHNTGGGVVVASATPILVATDTADDAAPVANQEAAIVAMVNDLRTRQGLGTLSSDRQLTQAAQIHSDDMATADVLSHTGTDGSEPSDRADRVGYTWSTVGENVLYQWDIDAAEAFDSWFNSPGHYENMVNPAFTEIGIAYTPADSGRIYYTMVLGAPR